MTSKSKTCRKGQPKVVLLNSDSTNHFSDQGLPDVNSPSNALGMVGQGAPGRRMPNTTRAHERTTVQFNIPATPAYSGLDNRTRNG